MKISAINASPIKPQAGGWNTYAVFGNQDVDRADRIMSLSKDLSDNFKKEGQDSDLKNPLQIAASVAGAVASTFLLGAGVARLGVTGYRKIPESAKASVAKTAGKVKDFAGKQLAKLPKPAKLTNLYNKTAGKAVNFVKNGVQGAVAKHGKAKVFTAAAGLLSTATLLPSILKAEDPNDGNNIPDIADKTSNAYATVAKNFKGVYRTAEIFSDIVSALS